MNRRGFLTGLTSLIAAPAIVPFSNLMAVRGIVVPVLPEGYMWCRRSITFAELMREYLEDHIDEVADSMMKHNALFHRLIS